MGDPVSYIDSRLRPGEKVLFHVQRSRDWPHLAKSLVIDVLILAAAILLARYLNHSMVQSYLSSGPLGGLGGFVAASLLTGFLPILVFVALAQDFAFTFFVELALTDRRILGRIAGPLWTRTLDLPHSQVRGVQGGPFGYLIIQRYRGRPDLLISGFDRAAGFAGAYQLFCSSRRIDRRSEPLRFKPAG